MINRPIALLTDFGTLDHYVGSLKGVILGINPKAVVFDITHAIRKYGIPSADAKGGAREFLPVLSRAGVAAGVDGIFIETHPEPEKALCDAASQLSVYALEEFLKPLISSMQLR